VAKSGHDPEWHRDAVRARMRDSVARAQPHERILRPIVHPSIDVRRGLRGRRTRDAITILSPHLSIALFYDKLTSRILPLGQGIAGDLCDGI